MEGDDEPDIVRRNPPRDWAAPPPWLASAEARRATGEDAEPPGFLGHRSSDPAQGLAGSAADRLAGGPPPAQRPGATEDAFAPAAPRAPEPPGEWEDEPEAETPPRRPTRRPRAYTQHLGGTDDAPDWERPRRYEAYPAIRSRMEMPNVPRTALMAGAVAILAIALFFLPGILNLGGPPAGVAPSGSVIASRAPSLAPTEPPAPTPVVYTIKKGDTLSKIATRNGLTLEELMAANPTIKDPNKISEGQQIIVPTPSEAPPAEIGGSPAASAAP